MRVSGDGAARTTRRAGGLIAAVIAAVWLGLAGPAAAFVLETPDDAEWAPHEDVDRAARWDAVGGDLVGQGVRGLGGGLEYALHPNLCSALTFIDQAPCAEIAAAVAEAARRWAQGHPLLSFTDVSPRMPAAAEADPGDWLGAEIDILAASPQEFARFQDPGFAAITTYHYDLATTPTLTSGDRQTGSLGALQAVDIRISSARCYYIDVAAAQSGCAHFPSLILHELGHALGIDHPDERPERNLAVIGGGCASGPLTYHPGAQVEPAAVMTAALSADAAWLRGLTSDDLAARDALYPPCPRGPAVAVTPVRQRWAAFATADNGATLTVDGAESRHAAAAQIDAECRAVGRVCRTLATFVGCFAYAEGPQGSSGAAVSPALKEAEAAAIAACAADGTMCRVRDAFCAGRE